MKRTALIVFIVIVAGGLGLLAARLLTPSSPATPAQASAHSAITRVPSPSMATAGAAPAGTRLCGTVTDSLAGDKTVQVTLMSGAVSCAQALQVADQYYNNPANAPQGSGGFSKFDGWVCQSASGYDLQNTGHGGDCANGGASISLDNPGVHPLPSASTS